MYRTFFLVGCLVLSVHSYAINKTNISNTSHEDDEPTKVILQTELNVYDTASLINTSIQRYSQGWNYGFQITNIRLSGYTDQVSFENDTYINGAKSFQLYDELNFQIGAQVGTTLNSPRQLHVMGITELTYGWFDGDITWHGGLYHVNDELSMTTQRHNVITGIRVKYDQVIGTFDYYGGTNNISGSVLNIYYRGFANIRPYIGVQIPTGGGEYAANMGFTLKLN